MQIEHHQRFCFLISISNLTCCKFVALKENTLYHSFQNYNSNHTKLTSQGAFYGGSGFETKEGTEEGSDPPHQNIESSPFTSCLTPPPTFPHWKEKIMNNDNKIIIQATYFSLSFIYSLIQPTLCYVLQCKENSIIYALHSLFLKINEQLCSLEKIKV